MNAFADTILSMMFGWLKTLVQGIWSSATTGSVQNFFVWLGDHWFYVVLGVCVLCTVVDYLIWLIRWRPYIIWRNRLRRLFSPHRNLPLQHRQFRQGYDSGVEMDLSDMPPADPHPEYVHWQPQNYTAPSQEQPEYAELAYSPSAYTELASQPYWTEETAAPQVRNRRSQRYAKKKFRLSGILREEEENALLDGLPPAVSQEEAFHAPIYPEH